MTAKAPKGNKALPLLSGTEVVKTLRKLGWDRPPSRPGKGDHIILVKPGHRATLSIPNHKQVKRALLRGVLNDAGIAVEEFVEARRRPKGARKR